jgi:rhodanese-related sulfurtransferase
VIFNCARTVSALCILVSAFATACSRAPVQHDEQRSISTLTLATLLRAGVPMTLLDARTGTHDDGRRIPRAVQVAPDASAEDIARKVPSKDALVITYCKDPECPNFAKLAAHLRALGYQNVLEDPEGIEGWAAAGQEIAFDVGKTGGSAGAMAPRGAP